MSIMAGDMQNGGNNDHFLRLDDLINHTVRKAFGLPPTNIASGLLPAVQQRIIGERVEHFDDGLAKLRTQSFLPGLIPSRRIGNVDLRFRSDDHPPAHDAERNRRFISSSGMEDAEFAWWAARRDSTSASSASESGSSSNSNSFPSTRQRSASLSFGNSLMISVALIG